MILGKELHRKPRARLREIDAKGKEKNSIRKNRTPGTLDREWEDGGRCERPTQS